MIKIQRFFTYALVTAVLLIGAVSSAAAFSTSDLEGSWYGHTLVTGNWIGWETSTATITSSGQATVHWNASDGESGVDTDQINISSDGILTAQGANVHGVMTLDKKFFLATDTWGSSNEYALQTFVKGGGVFTTSDLAGVWYGHSLYTGQWNGWDVTTATIDNSGQGSFNYNDSAGDSGMYTGQLYINSNGIITAPEHPYVHGVMSPDKNFWIFTNTSETSGNGEYTINIYVKSSTNFSTSDLEGTWSGHALATGGWNGWEVTTATVNSSGLCIDNWNDSDGDTGTDTTQFYINSNGIITAQGRANAHGVMSPDKNFIIATDTWGSSENEYALQIFVKQQQPTIDTTVNLAPIIKLLLLQNND